MRVKLVFIILIVIWIVLVYLHAGCFANLQYCLLIAVITAGWSLHLVVATAVCLAGRIVIGTTVLVR